MGLFLDPLSTPIDLYLCLCQKHTVLSTGTSLQVFKFSNVIVPFFSKIFPTVVVSITILHINFRISLSVSTKKFCFGVDSIDTLKIFYLGE